MKQNGYAVCKFPFVLESLSRSFSSLSVTLVNSFVRGLQSVGERTEAVGRARPGTRARAAAVPFHSTKSQNNVAADSTAKRKANPTPETPSASEAAAPSETSVVASAQAQVQMISAFRRCI